MTTLEYYGQPRVLDESIYALVGIVDWHSTLGRRCWLNFGNVPCNGLSRYLFLKLDDRWANVYMYLEYPYNSTHPREQWHVAFLEGRSIRMVPYNRTTAADAEELALLN